MKDRKGLNGAGRHKNSLEKNGVCQKRDGKRRERVIKGREGDRDRKRREKIVCGFYI